MKTDDAAATPPEDGGRKKGTPLTRRNFVALALTAGASLILAPRLALADYAVGGGWFGSAGNWTVLKHGDGNWIGTRSGWFHWVCGHGQWIGVAIGLWAEVQYSNELYDAFHMQPLAACRDWNDQSGKRLWFSWDPDTYLKYWYDGDYTGDYGWALTNEHLGFGYGGWYATGLRDFGYYGKDFFFRRQREGGTHNFGLEAGFYNVRVGAGGDGGPWWGKDNCYLWVYTNGGYDCADPWYNGADFVNEDGVCPGDIRAGQEACRLENRWDLFGGVWKLTNACAEGTGQCMDVCGGGTSSGTDVWSWEYFGSTSQNWCVNPSSVDSLGAGHLHSLYPAHMPVLALAEPAGENGPSTAWTTGHNAKVYTQKSGHTFEGHSERAFWIGGSKDAEYPHAYVTCDATGRTLDLYAQQAENETKIQFYSNGYDDQWDNAAEQWDFEEVFFEGSVEMPAECEVGGGPVRCSDPEATCRPYDEFGTGQTPYVYRFVTTAEDRSVEEDGARVVGAYMRNGWGQVGLDEALGVARGIPAYRYMGLPYEMQDGGQRVTDFTLWVENTAFDGSLECTAHLAGGGTVSASFPVVAGGQGGSMPPRPITRGGIEPHMGTGTWSSGMFRQSGDAGTIEEVAVDDGTQPAGARALRLTCDGLGPQIGIAQDRCTTRPGAEYTQTVWVRAGRDGVSFDLCPLWRTSADDSNAKEFKATTEWQRFSLTARASESSYSAGYVYINGTDSPSNVAGDWIEVRGLEVTEGGHGAPSFPGAAAPWLAGRSETTDIVGVEFWLEGEIAEHYGLDYRAYSRVGHWSEHCYSDGADGRAIAGDMATSLGCFQIHMTPKPAGAKVVREWSTDPDYTPSQDDSGRYLHCLCRLSIAQPDAGSSAAAGGDFGDHDWMCDRYQGTVCSAAPTHVRGDIEVSYHVDGEQSPCYVDEAKPGVVYEPPAAAAEAAQKDDCLEVSGWFTDPEYTSPYVPREHTESFSLYAYNSCSLEYGTTDGSCVLDASYAWKADEGLAAPLDLAALYPAPAVVRWGEEVTFAGPWSAWCRDMGKIRKASSTPGVYATRAGGGRPLLKAAVKSNAVVYVDWPWSGYDGVASGWR